MRSKMAAFDHINNFPRGLVKSMFQRGFSLHYHLCPVHTDKLVTCQLNQANYFLF